MSALMSQRKVLVLNKAWRFVNIVTLEDALKKLTGEYKSGEPKARIIDCLNDFRTITWNDWTTMSPHPDFCPECNKILVEGTDEIVMVEGHYQCGKCNCPVGEKGIRTSQAVLRIPTVIQLSRYEKVPAAKVRYNRRTIYRRDNNTCQYCGCRPGTKELSLDHVVPRCQGGRTTWENVVVACTECNARKAGRTPKQANMVLLRQPKKPKHNFYLGEVQVKDWENFLGACYWLKELENDNS